jgi:hypothetical protein
MVIATKEVVLFSSFHGREDVLFLRQGHYVAQASLNLTIRLLQPPKCWDYRSFIMLVLFKNLMWYLQLIFH